jgi:hypothetical protein
LVYKSTLATGHSIFFICLKKFVALIISNPQQWKITYLENWKKKGEEIPRNVSIIWVQQMSTHPAPAHNIMFGHGIFFVSFGHLLFGV